MTPTLFLSIVALGFFIVATCAALYWIERRLVELEKLMGQRVELYLRKEVLNVQGRVIKQ